MQKLMLLIFCFLSLITACSTGSKVPYLAPATDVQPSQTLDPEQDPTYGARLWFTGIMSGKGTDVARYTCKAKADQTSDAAQNTQLLIGGLNMFLKELMGGSAQTTIDVSHATFVISHIQGTQAIVHIGGEGYATIAGKFQITQLDYEIVMIHEDNVWRYCGFASSAIE